MDVQWYLKIVNTFLSTFAFKRAFLKAFVYEIYTQIYHPLKEKLLASRKRTDDSDETENEAAVLESIDKSTPPGTAYVELLQMLNHDVLPGRAFYFCFTFIRFNLWDDYKGTYSVLSGLLHSGRGQRLATYNRNGHDCYGTWCIFVNIFPWVLRLFRLTTELTWVCLTCHTKLYIFFGSVTSCLTVRLL